MKALLVADDEKAVTNISEVLKSAGFDVIVYKWLLKAMDNLVEIKPHMIVVSIKDYPRHWKTLAQYSSNLETDYKPEMILYAPEGLSDEEKEKAGALKIRGIFYSCEVDGLEDLRKIISKKADIYSGYLTDPEQGEVSLKDIIPELNDLESISKDIDSLKEDLSSPFDINEAISQLEKAKKDKEDKEKNLEGISESDIIGRGKLTDTEDNGTEDKKMSNEDIEAKLKAIMSANKADEKEKAQNSGIDKCSCSFVFTNPITLAMVAGTARNYNGMTLEFTPDIPSFINNLAPETQISSASLKIDGEIKAVKAEVMSNDAKKLYLQIKK